VLLKGPTGGGGSYERGTPVAHYNPRNRDLVDPVSSNSGTYKTVKARLGLDFQVKAIEPFQVVPSSLGSGSEG